MRREETTADLVEMYGGSPVVMGLDWRPPAYLATVDMWLEKERDVEVVALVHCDTSSTLYNPLRELAKVAADHGVLLIVDAVTSPSVFQRHKATMLAAWEAAETLVLKPYPQTLECTCPTATASKTPIPATRLRRHIWDKYGVLLTGNWGPLGGEVMRIGHMGVQASLDHLATAVVALGTGLRDFDIYADVEKAVDAVVETFR